MKPSAEDSRRADYSSAGTRTAAVVLRWGGGFRRARGVVRLERVERARGTSVVRSGAVRGWWCERRVVWKGSGVFVFEVWWACC